MSAQRRLQVFLCHASQDKPRVRELYRRLSNEPWIDPWLDEEKLLPGQDWDLEIQQAIRAADIIVICLSKESVSKEGYVQREFKRALSYAEEKPEGTIYIVPLRFDDCTPPRKFQQWQWLDYSAADSWEKLFQSLRLRAERLGIAVAAVSDPSPAGFTPGGRPFFQFGGLSFVRVAAGDFYMGSDDLEHASPQHLVYQLNYDFYIGRHPVTNQEYASYLRATQQPIVMPKHKASHPVANVSWEQTQEFIAWLNKSYQADLPAGHRFRLPSEAEWEKSARGVEGNEYPWGNTFDIQRCNSLERNSNDTTPVGAFSPRGDSAFGAADMAGNVWEWTRTLAGNVDPRFRYPYRADDGREDDIPVSGERVMRGGSFLEDKNSVRCASRNAAQMLSGSSTIGFRVAVCPVNK